MVLQIRRWLPSRPLVLVGDSGYAVLDLLHFCQSFREPATLITGPRLDAELYAPAPPRRPGQNGRPRVKGACLPMLKELLNQFALSWISGPVVWYDGTTRIVGLASQTAVWYPLGQAPGAGTLSADSGPSRRVRHPGAAVHQLVGAPAQILEWFALRWQLEVTFQEVWAHLGGGDPAPMVRPGHSPHPAGLDGLFSWITLAAQSLQ